MLLKAHISFNIDVSLENGNYLLYTQQIHTQKSLFALCHCIYDTWNDNLRSKTLCMMDHPSILLWPYPVQLMSLVDCGCNICFLLPRRRLKFYSQGKMICLYQFVWGWLRYDHYYTNDLGTVSNLKIGVKLHNIIKNC